MIEVVSLQKLPAQKSEERRAQIRSPQIGGNAPLTESRLCSMQGSPGCTAREVQAAEVRSSPTIKLRDKYISGHTLRNHINYYVDMVSHHLRKQPPGA